MSRTIQDLPSFPIRPPRPDIFPQLHDHFVYVPNRGLRLGHESSEFDLEAVNPFFDYIHGAQLTGALTVCKCLTRPAPNEDEQDNFGGR